MKKFLCIFLTCIMTMIPFTQVYSAPSKTISSITIADITAVTGETFMDGLSVSIVEPHKTAHMVELILNTPHDELISLFQESVQNTIHETFTDGFTISELVSFEILGYTKNYGTIDILFKFITKYENKIVIAGILGCSGDENNPEWYLPETKVIDGFVEITLIDDLFDYVDTELLLVILTAE